MPVIQCCLHYLYNATCTALNHCTHLFTQCIESALHFYLVSFFKYMSPLLIKKIGNKNGRREVSLYYTFPQYPFTLFCKQLMKLVYIIPALPTFIESSLFIKAREESLPLKTDSLLGENKQKQHQK